jgi:hypothetical protein
MSFPLHDTAVRRIDFDNLTINGADHAERHGRHIADRVSKKQNQEGEHQRRKSSNPPRKVDQRESRRAKSQQEEGNSLLRDEKITPASHD